MSVVHCPACGSGFVMQSVPPENWSPTSPYLPLVREICEQRGYTFAQIQAPDRTREATRTRRAAMRAAQEAGASLREIGHLFRRDHSTVLAALKETA